MRLPRGVPLSLGFLCAVAAVTIGDAKRLLRHEGSVSSRKPAKPVDFFTGEQDMMAAMPTYTPGAPVIAHNGKPNKALWHPAQPACQPKCSWTCGHSECDEACEPVCPPPKCQTMCKPSIEKCETRCAKPQCAVICPSTHCPTGDCPKCKTVCAPPQCTTQCNNACESHCEPPKCSWKCQAASCPQPACRLDCRGSWKCDMDFPDHPRNKLPVAPGKEVMSSADASLDASSLYKEGPSPPAPWEVTTTPPPPTAERRPSTIPAVRALTLRMQERDARFEEAGMRSASSDDIPALATPSLGS